MERRATDLSMLHPGNRVQSSSQLPHRSAQRGDLLRSRRRHQFASKVDLGSSQTYKETRRELSARRRSRRVELKLSSLFLAFDSLSTDFAAPANCPSSLATSNLAEASSSSSS